MMTCRAKMKTRKKQKTNSTKSKPNKQRSTLKLLPPSLPILLLLSSSFSH
jgi:hypothetical protein